MLKQVAAALLPLRARLASGAALIAMTGAAQAQSAAPAGMNSLHVIEFSMFLGAMGAALLSAIWLIRERGKSAAENAGLRGRVAELTAALDRTRLLLASRDARTVIWDAKSGTAELIGAMPPASGAPQDRAHFLAFGRWLEPSSAAALDRAVAALRERGTSFEMTCRTITGEQVETQGRRAGANAFVRFTGLSGLQADAARLRQDVEALSLANSQFTTLLNALPFPVWQREKGGKLVWSNAAWQTLMLPDGAPGAQAADGPQSELFGTQAREQIERKRQAGHFADRVATVIDGDRKVFDVVDIATETGSAGLARDVSEMDSLREEYERTLRSQSDTLNQLTTAVAIFDAGQKLRSFNSAFQRLWGLDIPFLESAPEHGLLLDRLRAESKLPEMPEWRRWREQVLSVYRAPEGGEDWWHLPDGKTLRVLANPQPKGGAIVVFENVTEKVDLETRYNTLIRVQGETLDNLAEGVAVFGSDGKVRLSNPSFAALWNLPAELAGEGVHISAVRAACRDLAPGGEWDQFAGWATGFDDARETRQGEIELASGGILAWSMVPLPKGQTMLTFVDVTDSARVERALKDKNEALQRADLLKNDFIQHVSYELRSPLTNIIGFTELMQQPSTGPLTERQRDYLDHIAVSSSVLLTTVNDILDLATVDAGIMDLEVGEIDVPSLFETVSETFAARFAEENVTLKTSAAMDASRLKGDGQRVRQILGNLLSNAVGHAPQGSVVTLASRREGNVIILSVHDEGPGIPAEMLAKVFDRFVAHGTSAKRGGAGLGLSIVKGLTELHQGTVSIRSAAGAGTIVECRFPADPSAFQAAAE